MVSVTILGLALLPLALSLRSFKHELDLELDM